VAGVGVIFTTPVDIFPNINIPVVSVIWNYTGFSPEQMSNRIITIYERSLTTTVNDIEHIESNSLNGIAVVKIFFRPSVNISNAVAQVTAISQTQLRQLPTGTTPPLVIQYSASSVPIIQLALSGQGLSEQQLNDFGLNFIRTNLATVQGAALPYPYGGKQRQVQVDINSNALQAKGISPNDVVSAIGAQNIILPGGTEKIGDIEYEVETNSSPTSIQGLNDLPIKTVNGNTVYLRDVGNVRDGFPPQTNIVRVDGQRASLLTVLKNGNSSTLDIIQQVRERLPFIKSQLPAVLQIKPLSDQSIFVRASIDGVVREAMIAAVLTGLMILLFLGSWRSTVIIAVSIPLSILCSLIMLRVLGETFNIMTLGGLALAVGILVDDATVEIENINRNLEEGKEIEQAILDGASQIAIPALVSTLAICIVFVPMFALSGVARYLFVPLAEAVVFAMLASYMLSRTVVPTMAKYLLQEHNDAAVEKKGKSRNPFTKFQLGFERHFENMRDSYHSMLALALEHAAIFAIVFLVLCVGSAAFLYPWLGQDFFPSVDSGQFKLHVRARTGTRIEETARLCDQIDAAIRREIPQSELVTIIDNVGVPYSGLNLSYSNSAPIGPADADIQVQLAEKHHSTDKYVANLRRDLADQFPGVEFYTLPVDIVTQILNFGLPAPLDIQVIGPNLNGNREIADHILDDLRYVPGASDTRIQQPFNQPNLLVDVNRSKAQSVGLNDKDVSSSLLVALSGSFQTTPTYFLDPKTGVSYNVSTQTPQYDMDSLNDLRDIPVTDPASPAGTQPQILGNVAAITRGSEQATVTHYNIQPVLDVYGNVDGTDLASIAKQVDKIVQKYKKNLPRGTQLEVRGQIQTMRSSFDGLVLGLVFSIALVYLLIVINFQSWLDPFIIITALPAALSGIVWFLFLTRTHISVPALTGSIMCMGVATANSILVVSFAREQMQGQMSAKDAAISAGFTRFRPVLMTALAMIIGMVPMALGLGDGGEQNAPLGRAVIGGLLFATVSTLFFVPAIFSLIHGHREKQQQAEDKFAPTAEA
jgi:CzcA family heavy metal efflux pump